MYSCRIFYVWLDDAKTEISYESRFETDFDPYTRLIYACMNNVHRSNSRKFMCLSAIVCYLLLFIIIIIHAYNSCGNKAFGTVCAADYVCVTLWLSA